jgi:hypothetical protein
MQVIALDKNTAAVERCSEQVIEARGAITDMTLELARHGRR